MSNLDLGGKNQEIVKILHEIDSFAAFIDNGELNKFIKFINEEGLEKFNSINQFDNIAVGSIIESFKKIKNIEDSKYAFYIDTTNAIASILNFLVGKLKELGFDNESQGENLNSPRAILISDFFEILYSNSFPDNLQAVETEKLSNLVNFLEIIDILYVVFVNINMQHKDQRLNLKLDSLSMELVLKLSNQLKEAINGRATTSKTNNKIDENEFDVGFLFNFDFLKKLKFQIKYSNMQDDQGREFLYKDTALLLMEFYINEFKQRYVKFFGRRPHEILKSIPDVISFINKTDGISLQNENQNFIVFLNRELSDFFNFIQGTKYHDSLTESINTFIQEALGMNLFFSPCMSFFEKLRLNKDIYEPLQEIYNLIYIINYSITNDTFATQLTLKEKKDFSLLLKSINSCKESFLNSDCLQSISFNFHLDYDFIDFIVNNKQRWNLNEEFFMFMVKNVEKWNKEIKSNSLFYKSIFFPESTFEDLNNLINGFKECYKIKYTAQSNNNGALFESIGNIIGAKNFLIQAIEYMLQTNNLKDSIDAKVFNNSSNPLYEETSLNVDLQNSKRKYLNTDQIKYSIIDIGEDYIVSREEFFIQSVEFLLDLSLKTNDAIKYNKDFANNINNFNNDLEVMHKSALGILEKIQTYFQLTGEENITNSAIDLMSPRFKPKNNESPDFNTYCYFFINFASLISRLPHINDKYCEFADQVFNLNENQSVALNEIKNSYVLAYKSALACCYLSQSKNFIKLIESSNDLDSFVGRLLDFQPKTTMSNFARADAVHALEGCFENMQIV